MKIPTFPVSAVVQRSARSPLDWKVNAFAAEVARIYGRADRQNASTLDGSRSLVSWDEILDIPGVSFIDFIKISYGIILGNYPMLFF